MQLRRFASVAYARLSMIIDTIGPPDEDGLVIIREQRPSDFELYVPELCAEKLLAGSTIEVLCIPTADLATGLEALVIVEVTDTRQRLIYALSKYWVGVFDLLGPSLS